jgi:HSP20 family protein
MRRLFDTFFDDMLTPFAGFPTFGGRGLGTREMIPERSWPRVDVTEDQNNVFVYADLPGIDEKDLEVSVEEDRIIIRGEKREETEESDRDYYYHERGLGSFERVLPLPVEVRSDAAQANFRNGLLTVTLPKEKQQSLNRRQIPISTGERGAIGGRQMERQGEERRERERELV